MTIHLFTTTDLRGERAAAFARLIDSIARNRRPGLQIRLHVLLQNCPAEALATRLAGLPLQSRLRVTPARMPLSAARNHLMAAARAEGPFGADDVIAFPDDDCWYPDGLLARLETVFRERPRLDTLLCRVSLQPDAAADTPLTTTPATAAGVVRLTMSNSLFVRGRLASMLGAFDTGLGLGTPAQGGEDTEYAMRAYLAGRETGFVDRALVGHPPADRRAAARYYHGATVVLARFARRDPALMREFLRKLLVGLCFVGLGRISPHGFLAALRAASGAFAAVPFRRRGADPVAGDGISRPLAR